MGIRVVPKSVRKVLHPATRRMRRPGLVRALETVSAAAPDRLPSAEELQALLSGWSKGSGAADKTVLLEVARLCREAEGPVLECGSGATTFVAAIYARHGCWSLEHHDGYRRQVEDVLERSSLDARVQPAPLVDYGTFDWYAVPDGMPDRFSGVICDGPPAGVRGGRFGLMPVMGARLAGSTILLDDADREGERAVAQEWTEEFGLKLVRAMGRAAVLTVPT